MPKGNTQNTSHVWKGSLECQPATTFFHHSPICILVIHPPPFAPTSQSWQKKTYSGHIVSHLRQNMTTQDQKQYLSIYNDGRQVFPTCQTHCNWSLSVQVNGVALVWDLVTKKIRTRYSGHLVSRLAGNASQQYQTTWVSYFMRGKLKGHSERVCLGMLELNGWVLVTTFVTFWGWTRESISVYLSSTPLTMGWLADLGPSYRCTCLSGYTNLE
jgi:hypothetical protein